MRQDRKNLVQRVLDPALLIAGCITAAFYALMFQPFMHGTVLHHYTTEHPVEYVVVALFIWGLVDVCLKQLSFPKENLALRHEWLPPRQGREPVAHASAMLEQIVE